MSNALRPLHVERVSKILAKLDIELIPKEAQRLSISRKKALLLTLEDLKISRPHSSSLKIGVICRHR